MDKSTPKFTIKQFRERFPNDDACLDYLLHKRYGHSGCPYCAIDKKLQRVKNRRCYQCPTCTYQVYPTAGTIFEKTTTPLTYWFFAIFLYSTTRNGVAAKELERVLGVCYKTALRMAHQIRTLMLDTSDKKLYGEVMMDESYLGGKITNKHAGVRKEMNKKGTGYVHKTAVFGMMEKDGRVLTRVVFDDKVDGSILKPIIREKVDTLSVIVTDGFGGYKDLHKEFKAHIIVNHQANEFVKDGYSTNPMENYWSHLKRMIKGTHITVSRRHLYKYIAEHSFRYVHRKDPNTMFDKILKQI